MLQFARENPIITLFIVIAVLGTVRAIVPWARRSREED